MKMEKQSSSSLKERIGAYEDYLKREERSENTIIQYRRDIRRFLIWMEMADLELQRETVLKYKELLQETYQVSSVNTKLAALCGFFKFLERPELKVKQLKIQRRAYCPEDRELTKDEYERLVAAARGQEKERLALLIQTICATGIRVSELKFITAEAVKRGTAAIRLKGKARTILIPEQLRRLLRVYIKKEAIRSGPVFVTRTGKSLNRSNIWRMMKRLCHSARVDERKVFPHNLRHLFARCFYGLDKDIVRLADVLGHSSIATTRLYIVSSGAEHRRQMERLGLVTG